MVSKIVEKYQELLQQTVTLNFGKRRSIFGKPGVINRIFVLSLCGNKEHFLNFLKETRVIKSEYTCPKCSAPMKIRPDKKVSDGSYWVCRALINGNTCSCTRTLRDNSWFAVSRLTMPEIFILTYEIVRGRKHSELTVEYSFAHQTICDWHKYVREKMLGYLEESSEQIGGPGIVVEVNECKFGKRKENEEIPQDQWVMTGVERGTGRLFIGTVHDQTRQTLTDIITQWIYNDTTIHLDSSVITDYLGKEGCNYLAINHNIAFTNSLTEGLRPANETTFKQFRNVMSKHNRQGTFESYLAHYIFDKSCAYKEEDSFIKFLEVIANWPDSRGLKRKIDSEACASTSVKKENELE